MLNSEIKKVSNNLLMKLVICKVLKKKFLNYEFKELSQINADAVNSNASTNNQQDIITDQNQCLDVVVNTVPNTNNVEPSNLTLTDQYFWAYRVIDLPPSYEQVVK
jgi:hypothetical protein